MSPTTTRPTLPEGDSAKATTEMGSLYVDPDRQRVVRLSDYENFDDYCVEVWALVDEDNVSEWNADLGEVANGAQFWSQEEVNAFAEKADYLAGHCFDGHAPYGVWTSASSGHPCPQCGKFMEQGFYHGGGGRVVRKFYPGLVCPDNHDRIGSCDGHMDYETLRENRGYVTVSEYIERRFGGDA